MDMYERLYFAKYVRKMRVSLTPDHDFNRFPWQSSTLSPLKLWI